MDLAAAPTPPPAPVRAAATTLAEAGHRAWLAGDALLALWPGASPPRPDTPVLLTDAPREATLSSFPRGVVTGPDTLMLPTPAGPLDLIAGQSLPGTLEDAGLTVHAVGWEPATEQLHDPYGGLSDLRTRRLRTIRPPADTFACAPLLALRALRLVGELGLAFEASTPSALAAAPVDPTPALRAAGRGEIVRALCGPHAGDALRLATASGLASRLAPGADGDLACWVDRLPPRTELRLAAWLGTNAAAWLRAWRFNHALRERVVRLARHHPLEQAAHPRRDASVGRLLTRTTSREREWLAHARRAQLESNTLDPDEVARARARLAALDDAIARVEQNRRFTRTRSALALSGAQVVEQLACPPGPRVGHALRHLAALVEAEPRLNTPEALATALAKWAEQESGPPPGKARAGRQSYGSRDARPKRSKAREQRAKGNG